MNPVVRRAGIAFGSFVAAWLVVWLVGGMLGAGGSSGLIAFVAAFILGGLVYADIMRRDRPAT